MRIFALTIGILLLTYLMLVGLSYFLERALSAGRAEAWTAAVLGGPYVIAHRGASGEAPENTLPAFTLATEQGALVLELDLWRSADGVWFAFHDDVLDDLTDGSGPLGGLTEAELETLDAAYHFNPGGSSRDDAYPFRGTGVRIPRLAEVMEAFPEAKMIIEIKERTREAGEALAAFLADYDGVADRVMVGSFSQRALDGFREAAPDILTGASADEVRNFYIASRLGLSGLLPVRFDALQVPQYRGRILVAHPRLIAAAHRRGLPVQVWTVNDPVQMEHLYAAGADAVITDFPARAAVAVAAARGAE